MYSDKCNKSIWVTPQQALLYENADSDEAKADIVLSVIRDKKIDFTAEAENLQEAALVFKGVCLTHKSELKKVYNEQNDLLYKMWEEMGDVSTKVRKHSQELAAEVKVVANALSETSRNVASLKESLADMNVYGAERLVELAGIIERLDDNTKLILSDILAKTK